jgi:hypothetical protein
MANTGDGSLDGRVEVPVLVRCGLTGSLMAVHVPHLTLRTDCWPDAPGDPVLLLGNSMMIIVLVTSRKCTWSGLLVRLFLC